MGPTEGNNAAPVVQQDPMVLAQAYALKMSAQTERDLALAQISPAYAEMLAQEKEFQLMQRSAELLATSGMFEEKIRVKEGGEWTDVVVSGPQATARACVRVMLGKSMGFGAAEAMQAIDVINGKPAIAAAARAARTQASGIEWDIQWHEDEKRICVGCSLHLKRGGRPMVDPAGKQVVVSFMKADAEALRTQIWEWNEAKKKKMPRDASVLEKDNWKGSPRNMYFSRAASNAQRWYAPGALNNTAMMTREEAMDAPPVGTGEFIEMTPDPETAEFCEPQRKQAAADVKPETTAEAKPEPKQETAGEASDAGAVITAEQKKELLQVAFEAGRGSKADMQGLLKHFGFPSADAVTQAKLPEILAELRKGDAE